MATFYVFISLSLTLGLAGVWHAGNYNPGTGPSFTCGILLGACLMSFAAIWLSVAIRALEAFAL